MLPTACSGTRASPWTYRQQIEPRLLILGMPNTLETHNTYAVYAYKIIISNAKLSLNLNQ